jgi:hypothetical protein
MKVADLSEVTRQKIAKVRYDQIIEPRSGSEIDPLKASILSEHDMISPIEGSL